MNFAIGLVLAGVSSLALNWGFFAQHEAASGLPRLALSRPLSSLASLFANWRWLSGYVIGWLGWGLYVLALHFAPLSIVQAISASGIGILVVLARRHRGTARNDRLGTAAALLGLSLLGASLIGAVPHSRPTSGSSLSLALVALLVPALALLVAVCTNHSAAFSLGAIAGLCYAAGDVATKGALIGGAALLVPLLLACHLAGFVALQHAFQRGGPVATAGTCNLLGNLTPIVIGVAVFHESTPTGALGVLRWASFALVVCSCVLLARAPTTSDTESEKTRPASATTLLLR